MDALSFLRQQHIELRALFRLYERSLADDDRRALFEEIGDALAIHASIEERFFYPVVRAYDTARQVGEAYDEHLEIKRLLVECLRAGDDLDDKMASLKEAVEHHVDEEESGLFPKVQRLLGPSALDAVGQRLEAEAFEMQLLGAPRERVTVEIEPPATF
jgi:hypothetical protein